jgi:hypothetical protein
MATCGLDHYGRPEDVSIDFADHPHLKTIRMPMHGRISTERARLNGYGLNEDDNTLTCSGTIRQASVFGEVLELRRTITLPLFGSTMRVDDVVKNLGYRPSRHALLYHVNFGFPFLDEGLTISGTTPQFDKLFLDVPVIPSDDAGELVDVIDSRKETIHQPVVISSPKTEIDVSLAFDERDLPNLCIWRAYRSGIFALGVEPSTDKPCGSQLILPGEKRRYGFELTLGNRFDNRDQTGADTTTERRM